MRLRVYLISFLFAAHFAAFGEGAVRHRAAGEEREMVFPAEELLSGRLSLRLPDRTEQFEVIGEEWNSDGSETIYLRSGSLVSPVTRRFGAMRATLTTSDSRTYDVYFRNGRYIVREKKEEDFTCLTAFRPRFTRSPGAIFPFAAAVVEEMARTSKRRSVQFSRPVTARILMVRCTEYADIAQADFDLSAAHYVSALNATLINSGLPWARLELAGTRVIECPKDAATGKAKKIQEILDWSWQDAAIDAVRVAAGADLVTIFAKDPGNFTVGIAYRAFPDFSHRSDGFAVIGGTNPLSVEWLVVHEVMHNLGCDHNPEDAKAIPYSEDPAPYARDYYRCGPGGARGAVTYKRCNPDVPILLQVSNPAIMVNGASFGVPDWQDNARVMRTVFGLVAKYLP